MEALTHTLDERGKKIFDLTVELVQIPSMTGSSGECDIADTIYKHLAALPYFKKFPKKITLCPVGNTGKMNVLAQVQGEGEPSRKTVLYLGHLDTVDIKEYKSFIDIACNPTLLHQQFAKESLPPEVELDLQSGEWLFGRGTTDMKTGVAVLMQLFEEAASAPERLSGNILLAIVADEEADSRGMLALAEPLYKLIHTEELEITGCINTDVVSTRDGCPENRRYIYHGSMGKIVPAIYTVGRGAHVGESLHGFDVNMLLSRLTWLLDNNMEFSDALNDSIHTYPPVSLKQADLKEDYNGQVPYEGYAYYNFLNYRRKPAEIIAIMRRLTKQAFEDCIEKMQNQTKFFCTRNQQPEKKRELTPRVFDFEELCTYVRKNKSSTILEQTIRKIETSHKKEMELREYSLSIVREVWKVSGLTGPAAVLFIMPPYYPANDPHFANIKFQQFYSTTCKTLQKFAGKGQYDIRVEDFFPYLSDASFCAYTEGEENRHALEKNMPCWNRGWGINLPLVEQLNIPVLDMGVHGKDFHKIYERVHVPYSMTTLPHMIHEVTQALLKLDETG